MREPNFFSIQWNLGPSSALRGRALAGGPGDRPSLIQSLLQNIYEEVADKNQRQRLNFGFVMAF